MIGQRLRAVIVSVVTFVWAVNLLASLIPPLKYESDPTVHAVFMAIVGGAVALSMKKNGNGGNGITGSDEGR